MAVMHADFSFLSCLQSAFEILVYRIASESENVRLRYLQTRFQIHSG